MSWPSLWWVVAQRGQAEARMSVLSGMGSLWFPVGEWHKGIWTDSQKLAKKTAPWTRNFGERLMVAPDRKERSTSPLLTSPDREFWGFVVQ